MRHARAVVGWCGRGWPAALVGLLGGLLLFGSGCGLTGVPFGGPDHRVGSDPDSPQTAPFDRGTMTRSFQPTEAGGIEQVVARDPGDPSQLNRIRASLREEAAAFQQGHYEDPAKIHGMVMPGSKELEAGYSRVDVSYADLPSGGQLTYSAADQTLVQALHTWFDRRQLGG
jgi:hypothetical protein